MLFVGWFAVSMHAQGQQSTVVGYVYDQAREPLAGVVVKVDNTNLHTVTDKGGRFFIKGEWKKNTKLIFSYLGYKEKTVSLNNNTVIEVVMNEDALALSEVVVRAKSNINAIDLRNKAGQVEAMDMKRIEAKPMIDFALSLQGQIPGLVVTNSGELGATPKIRIRGNSSLRAGNKTNEPLYVMDGQVISSETFYNLNPQDIKDIKVLKDAAACALYGVKSKRCA